ncbi:MAG TPA: SH3 domain-containing protein [Sulfuricaulis sp.]
MIAKLQRLRIPYVLTVIVWLLAFAAAQGCAEEGASTRETVPVTQNAPTPTSVIAQNSATNKITGAAVKETGTTRSAVELMTTPYRDAKSAGQLPVNTRVDVLERRGGWLKISAQGKTGWAKLHQVRAGVGPEGRTSGEGLAILKNVGQTGRSGSQGIVATTGIRGMSAEELNNANPDPAAVKKLESYSVTANQARDYAKAAGLKEKNVPPLPKSE